MNTADKPKRHNYRPDHHALENEDLGAYLVQTDDVPFRDEQNAIAYATAGMLPNGEEDQLQTYCDQLRAHITSLNYPDPGNLRTNKKKDVRARLKCLGILLKQR
jgi:hypothetical protein